MSLFQKLPIIRLFAISASSLVILFTFQNCGEFQAANEQNLSSLKSFGNSNYAMTIFSISPANGTTQGGTSVTITGSGFVTGMIVHIGGVNCNSVHVLNSDQLTCVTGAANAGTSDVEVLDPVSQTVAAKLTGSFQFSASQPSQCPENYVLSGGNCYPATQLCPVTNGSGIQLFASGNFGACLVYACEQNFASNNGSCQPWTSPRLNNVSSFSPQGSFITIHAIADTFSQGTFMDAIILGNTVVYQTPTGFGTYDFSNPTIAGFVAFNTAQFPNQLVNIDDTNLNSVALSSASEVENADQSWTITNQSAQLNLSQVQAPTVTAPVVVSSYTIPPSNGGGGGGGGQGGGGILPPIECDVKINTDFCLTTNSGSISTVDETTRNEFPIDMPGYAYDGELLSLYTSSTTTSSITQLLLFMKATSATASPQELLVTIDVRNPASPAVLGKIGVQTTAAQISSEQDTGLSLVRFGAANGGIGTNSYFVYTNGATVYSVDLSNPQFPAETSYTGTSTITNLSIAPIGDKIVISDGTTLTQLSLN